MTHATPSTEKAGFSGSLSKVVVVGGGPAGSFFAIEILRQARRKGQLLELLLFEQKKQPLFYQSSCSSGCREGCNYCAGGISPRMADVLRDSGIGAPPEVITGEVETVIVQGDWKNIELPVPAGRRMYSVHRGSRPVERAHRYENFDSYLLETAAAEGARILTGEVTRVSYSAARRPVVEWESQGKNDPHPEPIEADFVVFAGGVNTKMGMRVQDNPLVRSIRQLIPGFVPPKVRKALILELKPDHALLSDLQGEIYFVEYGSDEVQIEMSSFIPKEEFITVALLGPCIDRAGPGDYLALVDKLLDLPHIKRIFPRGTHFHSACICSPNMTVGTARQPYGHRVAIIGDLAVARLYKDGILSAYRTARALAECLLEKGADVRSLKKWYWPAVREIQIDNRYGRLVFLFSRIAFQHPILSRILYQAVLTERKSKGKTRCRLDDQLWRIAAGDATYRSIFISILRPANLLSILVGGGLVTLRNWLTETLFGLKWVDFGRFQTGVYREVLAAKRQEFIRRFALKELQGRLDFERMYSIQIKSTREKIFYQLGRFGEKDMEYFQPRMIRVLRLRGRQNEVGTEIRYHTPFQFSTFSLVLERYNPEESILYRVQDGFARGGVLIFDVQEKRPRIFLLSIYVAFNMPRGSGPLSRLYWTLFRISFPSYVHDVLWNHSLCKMKDVIERDGTFSCASP